MNDEFAALTLQSMLAPQTQALQQIAMRPQKSQVTTKSTPYALDDLLATRAKIGESRRALDEALKGREDLGYTLANALAGIPQQQGYGSWLGDFARAFGGGFTSPTNAKIDRMQKAYETEAKDLATILALDKAMGDVQTQEIGYTPMEYGTASGAKSREQQASGGSVGGIQATNFGRSVGYDPVEKLPDFGPITRAALSEEELGVMKYVPFSQSIAKGLTDKTATQLQSTYQDISSNILSGAVLDFVGKAGGIRVADTPAEQEFIFGPIRNYKNMTPRQLRAGLEQSRNNFVTAGINKARQAGVEVSEKELKDWWNSAFSVPKDLETKNMYNIQNKPQVAQQIQDKQKLTVGEVRNGIRFLGYNPDGSMKFEKVQ